MKKSKLGTSLEKFTSAYYTHYGTISPQVIAEMMDKFADDPSFKELLPLLSKDRAEVIETLQKSVAVNQIFFKIRNDFVDDFMKNLRDINHLYEEERRTDEASARKSTNILEKNKKLKQLTQELDLSSKQKQILKSILDLQ